MVRQRSIATLLPEVVLQGLEAFLVWIASRSYQSKFLPELTIKVLPFFISK
jgi:hypothetical protein